jgi:hypothetical protein
VGAVAVTRRIGLSLGADICWPVCYEELVRRLDLAIPHDGDTLDFQVERITIEPFDLRQSSRFDVVIDRLTHWYHTSREWIKKAVILNDLYVFNNPWSIQANEKQTTYCAMMRLGLPVPDTWLVPPKAYKHSADLQPTLERYARYFDLGEVGAKLDYPLFMKPYDGGAWMGVNKVDNEAELWDAYERSGTLIMNLQSGVVPYELFVRCIGLGPQVRMVNYDPGAPLHNRYRPESGFLDGDDAALLEDMTLTINSFFGWDFNSCEALSKDGAWYPIDFANACPDSQVTSDQGQRALVNLLRRHQAAHAPEPGLATLLPDRGPGFAVPRAPQGLLPDRPPALRDRAVPGVLPQPPVPPGRGGLRALRLGPGKTGGAQEGQRPIPAPRDRRVHRAVLGPDSGLAQD